MHHRSIPQIRSHTNESYLILPFSPVYYTHLCPEACVSTCLHMCILFLLINTKNLHLFVSKLQVKRIRSDLIYLQFLLFFISAVSSHLTFPSSLPGRNCQKTGGRIANHSLSLSKCRQTYLTDLCSAFLYWKQNPSQKK